MSRLKTNCITGNLLARVGIGADAKWPEASNEKAGLVTRLRFIQLVVGFLDDDDEASLDAASGNADAASLDVRFDFHTSILLMNLDVKYSAAPPYSRLRG
jgi:hypothetical protein